MGIAGNETPEELEANAPLRARLEAIRLQAGTLMNLGDVAEKSVPKMTMVSSPRDGGAIAMRTFITQDRKRGVEGKSGSVRIDLGGRRHVKKNTKDKWHEDA